MREVSLVKEIHSERVKINTEWVLKFIGQRNTKFSLLKEKSSRGSFIGQSYSEWEKVLIDQESQS